MTDTIGIIGLGSAGQRHMRNAWALGLNVVGYDPAHTNAVIHDEGWANSARLYPSIDALLDNSLRPDGLLGVIIATPPETHARVAADVATRDCHAHLFVEKPLAATIVNSEWVRRCFGYSDSWPVAVGYQLRHTVSLRRLKLDLEAGYFGGFVGASFHFASRLWASKTYDADFLLEISHEFDLARWLFGNPGVVCVIEQGPTNYRVVGFFGGRVVHFDLNGTDDGYRRFWTIHGDCATRTVNFNLAENDQAYVNELEDFIAVCRGEKAQPGCTGEDGWWALRIVEAIKRSAETRRWESV